MHNRLRGLAHGFLRWYGNVARCSFRSLDTSKGTLHSVKMLAKEFLCRVFVLFSLVLIFITAGATVVLTTWIVTRGGIMIVIAILFTAVTVYRWYVIYRYVPTSERTRTLVWDIVTTVLMTGLCMYRHQDATAWSIGMACSNIVGGFWIVHRYSKDVH